MTPARWPRRSGAGTADYTSSEGLRALLQQLHEAGPGSWTHDPVAGALMAFTADKYAALARKHGLDPWEAASAAFDVMRTRAAREADDPWAVITHAVRISCIAEERAQGLLCSTHQARRPHISALHDVERFSDREAVLTDYHPAFHVVDDHDLFEDDDHEPTSISGAVREAIRLLTVLGWPSEVAQAGVDHICTTLARAGSRQGAFEALRRDRHALALLDVPAASWSVLLRTVLGNQHPAYRATRAGRGLLLRILLGETTPELLRDADLVATITAAAPRARGQS